MAGGARPLPVEREAAFALDWQGSSSPAISNAQPSLDLARSCLTHSLAEAKRSKAATSRPLARVRLIVTVASEGEPR